MTIHTMNVTRTFVYLRRFTWVIMDRPYRPMVEGFKELFFPSPIQEIIPIETGRNVTFYSAICEWNFLNILSTAF